MNNNTKEEGNPQRKKELTDKVSMLVKTAREKKKPRNMQEGIALYRIRGSCNLVDRDII